MAKDKPGAEPDEPATLCLQPIRRNDSTADMFVTGTLNTIYRPPLIHVEVGALTHVGNVRQNNEDNFLVAKLAKALRICQTSLPHKRDTEATYADEEGYLMVVADGMGGANAGEKASAMAIENIEDFVLNAIQWFHRHKKGEEEKVAADLQRALERADRKITSKAQSDLKLSGMGTTVTMAFSAATTLYIVSAGDSRAYLYREGKLRQITRDDNMAQLLVETGAIKPEEAKNHPRRNVITNVVGGPGEGVNPQIYRESLRNGDILLLCTDGLYEPLPDGDVTIAQVLGRIGRGIDPQTAAETLAGIALQGKARDNLTCVIARYEIQFLPDSTKASMF